MAITIKIGGGEAKPIGEYGFKSAVFTDEQFTGGSLVVTLPTPLAAAQFAAPFTPCVLAAGETVVFRGWLYLPRKSARGGAQSRTLTFVSPWAFCYERKTFTQSRFSTSGLHDSNITTLGARMVIGGEGHVVRERMSMLDTIQAIADCVKNAGYPVDLALSDSIDDLHIPFERRVNDACSDALRAMLLWNPGLAGWWTHSLTESFLSLAEGATRPLRTFNPATTASTGVESTPRYDELFSSVDIRWVYKLEEPISADGGDGYSYEIYILQSAAAGPDGTELGAARAFEFSIELQQGETVPRVTEAYDGSEGGAPAGKTISEKLAEFMGRLQIDAKLEFLKINWTHQPGDRWTWAGILGEHAGRWSVAQVITRDLLKGTQAIDVGYPRHLGADGLAALFKRRYRQQQATQPDGNKPDNSDGGSKSSGGGASAAPSGSGFDIVAISATKVRVFRSDLDGKPPSLFGSDTFKDYTPGENKVLYAGAGIDSEGNFATYEFDWADSLPANDDTSVYIQIGTTGNVETDPVTGRNLLTVHNDCHGPIVFVACERPFTNPQEYNLYAVGAA